jgi:hypothetical protein
MVLEMKKRSRKTQTDREADRLFKEYRRRCAKWKRIGIRKK